MLAPARRRAALVVAFTAIFLSVPISQAHALPLFGFSGTTIAFPSTAVGGTSAGIAVTVTNVSAFDAGGGNCRWGPRGTRTSVG